MKHSSTFSTCCSLAFTGSTGLPFNSVHGGNTLNGRCAEKLVQQQFVPRRRRCGNESISNTRKTKTTTTAIFIWSADHEEDYDEMNMSDHRQHQNNNNNNDENDELNEQQQDEWSRTWRRSNNSPSPSPSSSPNINSGNNNSSMNEILVALNEITNGPEDMDGIRKLAPLSVCDAFRRVIQNIIGTLPGDCYDVSISCERHSISHLMQSCLQTGYATRNGEIRHILNDSMPSTSVSLSSYNKNGVWGGVVNENDEKEEICARDYIDMLEKENLSLKNRINSNNSNNNSLVEFLNGLEMDEIDGLYNAMSNDVQYTFKKCIVSVTGVVGHLNNEDVTTTYTMRRDYVGRMMLWCLHVGYKVRDIEHCCAMKRMFNNNNNNRAYSPSPK